MYQEDYAVNEKQSSVDTTKSGFVNCQFLNLREQPSLESEVLKCLENGHEVLIDESNSTNEFYKVYTASGIEGFCMKQFIDVR